ncbi:hypothetical protein N665_0076s0075 [Sinapis alba]|nr:hypothetical protein N665_0076s0075 [Sinapis alba]
MLDTIMPFLPDHALVRDPLVSSIHAICLKSGFPCDSLISALFLRLYAAQLLEEPFSYESRSRRLIEFVSSQEYDWESVMSCLKTDQALFVLVTEVTSIGFEVRFRALKGFLPFNKLAPKRKFVSYDAWFKVNKPLWARTDIEELYLQQKTSFMNTFLGKSLKVRVLTAERCTCRLIFTMRPKNEFLAKKKMMQTLKEGDLVECLIKKIAPGIGIFCELPGGITALIRDSQIPRNEDLKAEMLIEAKVEELNFSRQKIFLSMK